MHHIGPYRIETILAKGARGLVYKGYHEGLGREVVIKAQGADPEERRRIVAEAEVQLRIQHPSIAATYDLIEDQGQVFVAMEHVEGTSLDVLLERRMGRGFPLSEALDLFEQVLAALDHAHREGLIHRNLKPSNLMVCSGRIKVLDFPMALFRRTSAPALAAAAAYVSPEQLMSGEVDGRADLYCAAIVLFEMLAGRHPFHGATDLDLAQCQLRQVPPDLKILIPDLPAGVGATVSIALNKDPDRRFQTAGDFFRALREGAAGFLPVPPEPPSPVPVDIPAPVTPALPMPPSPLPRRQHRLVAATCFLVGLGLLGSFGFWKASYRPPATSPQPEPEPFDMPSMATPAPEPEPEPDQPVPTPSPDPPAVVSPTPGPVLEPTPEWEAAPPPPIPQGPDPEEIRRLEVGRLREEIGLGIEAAEADILAKGFDAAQEKVDRLKTQARRYPEEFPREIARLEGLQKTVIEALVRQRELQSRLQHIEKLLKQGKYPEADELARELGEESDVPEAMAARARELSAQAKEELKKIWGTTQTGPTRNKLRKPPAQGGMKP